MNKFELLTLRADLRNRSRWNIGYFLSGFLFWVFVAIIGATFPLSSARYIWLAGSFIIFPVSVGLSRLLRADPFCKGNSLGELVLYTHLSTFAITLPMVVLACLYIPETMLLVLAISYCVDFYVMTWAFGTPLFGIHAGVRTILVSLVWFTLARWQMLAIPLIVALAYLITVALIPTLNNRLPNHLPLDDSPRLRSRI